ncbi:unnamed protein product [Heterobilharzia americana]|nr:unnamed protein product [Heterobilharzia americana]
MDTTLRVSLLRSERVSSISKHNKLSSNSLSFTENELTIRDAIKMGLLDPNVPEVVVPDGTQQGGYYTDSYRRVNLTEAVQMGLIDDVSGCWLGSGSSSGQFKIGIEVAQAAGLLTKAPSLAELVLSGLISVSTPNMSEKHPNNSIGILDAHNGQYILFTEAVKRGMVIGNQPAMVLVQSHSNQPLTLIEALNMNIMTSSGFIVLEDKPPMNLWDAVNNNYVRLIYTKSYPPPVGVLIGWESNQKSNQTYQQHPILHAIRTGLIDSSKEEIVSPNTEARQHGQNSLQRRVALKKSAKHSALCDLHSIQLLTQGCGLFNIDGRELSGLDALSSGWFKLPENSHYDPNIYGQIMDPVTGTSMLLSSKVKTMKNVDITPSGAHLMLALSINRPPLGYLIDQRFITHLSWLGPGLHSDSSLNKASNDSWFTHIYRSDDILAVIDPISKRKVTQTEAVRRDLLDMETGIFRDPVRNQIYPISEAIEKGHILVKEKPIVNGSVSKPQSNNPEMNESFEIVSVKETCTYKILNVLDPHTSLRIEPNEAVKKGLINLESFTYNGVNPIHNTDYEVSHDSIKIDCTDKTPPYNLVSLFHGGQLVKQSGSKCVIKLSEYVDSISLNEAITLGLIDVGNSLVKEFATEKWYPLDKAILLGLVNDHKGVLLHRNKWIPLSEAITRGLVTDKKLSSTGMFTFEKALANGLIDPVTNTFHQSNDVSISGPSNSISVHDAIKQGLLRPPAVETLHESSNGLPNKGYTHSMDSLIAIKRQSLKDPTSTVSRNNTLPPVTSSGHVMSNGDDFIATGGRTESKIIKFLDCHGVGRLRGKSSHCNLRPKSKGNDDSDNGDEYTIRKKPRIKSYEMPKLKERNCVLYAFYYLHDDVRVEASITDTMVREGRVDVCKKIICDPTSGKFFPIPEALTKGFVFGIVFTQAEQLLEDGRQTSNPLYWLEVFHYRHDIYRLERVFDPYLNSLVSVTDAIGTGIIDPIHCTYTHPVNGNLYSIEEALYQGWIQALPVGNPPPFDLIGGSFDHVHVRTVEESTTFTTSVHTVRRGSKIPPQNLAKETCPTGQRSTLSSPQTTLNIKRQMPCKTPPSCRPNYRTPTDSTMRYQLKSDYRTESIENNQPKQKRESGLLSDIHPSEHSAPVKEALDKASQHLFSGKSSRLPLKSPVHPLQPIILVDSTTLPAISLSLVRYQHPDPTPKIIPKSFQNAPRYLLLETAIQRGWIDPYHGLLRTQCGRTSTLNLLEAVEEALIDPSQLLVCVQHQTEDDLHEHPLYGDQPIPVYYSLATLLDATNLIIQTVSSELRESMPHPSGLMLTDDRPTGSETTKRLISQLVAALDKEALWMTDYESQILQMGHLNLDDNLNRHLLDDHQEILDKIRIHQSTSRSILFQAEQAVETLRNTNQPEYIWKPLQPKCQELRTRLEDLQSEAEGRVRILLNSLDSLEHLTYKLQGLRNLLENLESVLVVSALPAEETTEDNQFTNKLKTLNHPDEMAPLNLRLKAALTEYNSIHKNVISTLPSVMQKFMASVHRYSDNKKTYNAKLNRFTGLECKRYEGEIQRNDAELEDRIQNTVKEANNRLIQLVSRLETQSTHLTEIHSIYDQYQKQLSESFSQLDKIKSQLNSIQKCILRPDELNTLSPNKIKQISQEQLNTLYALQGDLSRIENDLENLKTVDLHSLEEKLTTANLISTNLISVITEPLSKSLNYQEQLNDQCEKLEKQFMKYILTNQIVQECLNEFMNQTNQIGDNLSQKTDGSNIDDIIIKTDRLPTELTKLNETLAQINTMQSASQTIRNRLNQTVEQVKSSDPGKVRSVQSELKQTDVLDNRLETLKDDVVSRISQLNTLSNQLAQCENDLNEFNTWLDQVGNQLSSQATANLPENYFKHKIQSIKMQIPNRQLHLDNLRQSTKALTSRLPDNDPAVKLAKENIHNLDNRWSQVLRLLNTREDDLKARESFSDSYIQTRDQVQEMLLSADGRLTTLSSPITLNTNALKQQTERLNALYSFWETIKKHITEADRLGSAYDTLLHTSSGMERNFAPGTTSHDPYASSEINEVSRELDELHERYDQLGNCLNERRNEFSSLLTNLNSFEETRSELVNWLNEHMKAVNNVNKDISTIQSVNQAINDLKSKLLLLAEYF